MKRTIVIVVGLVIAALVALFFLLGQRGSARITDEPLRVIGPSGT